MCFFFPYLCNIFGEILLINVQHMYTLHWHVQAITDSFNSNGSKLRGHFSDTELYLAVAIYAIGGMTGALLSGIIADYIGRYANQLT